MSLGADLLPLPSEVTVPSAGAAAGTPAAGAWSDCAERIAQLSAEAERSITGLRNALNTASADYTTADQSVTARFTIPAPQQRPPSFR